jgi:MFS transporter, CP family, cyanate transporter
MPGIYGNKADRGDPSRLLACHCPVRQPAGATARLTMPFLRNSVSGESFGGLVKLLLALWLAGVAMRMALLAIPPVIPLVHEELHMTETQIGLLIGLPLLIFAVAAVPGSLLIARTGAKRAVLLGMVIAAFASGARGAAIDVWTLFAAAIATGFGIAVMQPGMPTLVRNWMPERISLGTLAYSSGMVMGASFPPALSIPFVLPLFGGSWRLDLVLWGVLSLLMVPLFFLLSPADDENDSRDAGAVRGRRWWPDWNSPLVWILGLTFGSNSSPFFAANAFIGDYLTSAGQTKALASTIGWLNGAQILALVVLFFAADRLQGRAWPYLIFGPVMLLGFLGLIFVPSPFWLVVSASMIGIATAITMTAILALPALLSAPADIPRTAAGMFTISYTCAIVVPTVSGALWDASGKPWAAFVPSCICAVLLAVLGTVATRLRPANEATQNR